MSLAQQIGDNIRQRIVDAVSTAFNNIGVTITTDNIINDCARFGSNGLEASFYVKDLDNVVRKDFNAQASLIKTNNPLVEEFKVKFKRPEKEVRFFLKVRNENS